MSHDHLFSLDVRDMRQNIRVSRVVSRVRKHGNEFEVFYSNRVEDPRILQIFVTNESQTVPLSAWVKESRADGFRLVVEGVAGLGARLNVLVLVSDYDC